MQMQRGNVDTFWRGAELCVNNGRVDIWYKKNQQFKKLLTPAQLCIYSTRTLWKYIVKIEAEVDSKQGIFFFTKKLCFLFVKIICNKKYL